MKIQIYNYTHYFHYLICQIIIIMIVYSCNILKNSAEHKKNSEEQIIILYNYKLEYVVVRFRKIVVYNY